MNYRDIKKTVQELFRDNIRLFPEMYDKSIEDGKENAIEVANGYFDNRDETEITHDKENEITISDYEMWCVDELNSWYEEYPDFINN